MNDSYELDRHELAQSPVQDTTPVSLLLLTPRGQSRVPMTLESVKQKYQLGAADVRIVDRRTYSAWVNVYKMICKVQRPW